MIEDGPHAGSRVARVVAAGIVVLAALASPLAGQQPTPTPRPPADSAATDTTLAWAPPDSTMAALLERQGYTVTRYQGDIVTFDAVSKAFAIAAAAASRAAVEREGQRVVTDSVIVYNDESRRVDVSGNFSISPGGGQAPIAGMGTAQYDLTQRSGRLTNANVTVEESGQRWFIESEIGKTALGDSARGIPMRFYGLGGSLTSCEDSIPDYHIAMHEIKRTDKTLVARPAVLYIRDIPVMWLPFFFQDIRPGRRSGVLPPRFGASDIVRNNSSYRRHVENIGYYWAMSDYADLAMWADWRSAAGGDSLDPGWLQLSMESKYNVLSRFLSGRLATSYMRQRDGREQLSLSWNHQERFGRNRTLTTNVNYTTSTQLHRLNTFSPYAAIATIASTAAYSDKLGPVSMQLGGSRTQYPGRDMVEQTLPTLSLTTGPLSLAPWLVWTPSFRFQESAKLHIDQAGTLTSILTPRPGGGVDSVRIDRNSYSRNVTFDSPITVKGMAFSNGITIQDTYYDFPAEKIVYPDADSAQKQTRVFAQTFRTAVDWNPSFSLPPIFRNRFKLTPSISLQNVDGNPFWVRTELSGGKFVHQSKRLTYGLSASPTIFGLWPGFGPFSRFRHSLNPTISYTYAPAKAVSTEYLEATGQIRQGYLGALAQSAISFGLTQNIEAKVRAPSDSSGEAQKLKVLSMQFTPLSYDFERARVSKRTLGGLTTDHFGTTVRSELLPGFDLSVDYSLFQGSTYSDTAVFKPYLTRIASTLRLSQSENPLTVINRLFGRAVPERSPQPQAVAPATESPGESAMARQFASQPIAGQAARGTQYIVPPAHGWEATLSFSTSRPRPPTGDRVVNVDPRDRCEVFRTNNPFAYDNCLNEPVNVNDELLPPTTAGAIPILLPRQTSLTGSMQFELTQKWAASWQSSYDFERRQFASQIVSLQRDLHDWRAVFAFTHSPNGNFAFNFYIALKPQPEFKFDYSRATVRGR